MQVLFGFFPWVQTFFLAGCFNEFVATSRLEEKIQEAKTSSSCLNRTPLNSRRVHSRGIPDAFTIL